MSQLRVTLALDATTLAAGEDPSCQLTIVHQGAAPVEVPNLDLNPQWPSFTLENLDTGALQSFVPGTLWAEDRVRPIARKEGDGPLLRMSPGETKTWVFPLSHRLRLPPAGRYRVRASFPENGLEVGTDAVELRIVRVETARSDLTYAHSGFSELLFESWVGREDQGLYLRAVRMRRRMRQLQCARIGRVPPSAEPLVSVAPNGEATESRCVAWLDGPSVVAVDVGLGGVTRPARSLALPGLPRFIVPRPWKDPASDDTEALIWLDQPSGPALLPVAIQREGIVVRPAVSVALPRPIWSRGFFRSTGERLAFLLVAGDAGLALHYLCHGDALVLASTPMATWEWSLLGVSAHLDADDTLRGVLVGQRLDAGAGGSVLYACWSLDGDGRFLAEAPRVWPDLDPHVLEHFQVAVDVQGKPHALVQWTAGDWACLSPGSRHDLAAPPGATAETAPVLRFMAAGTIPLVLWHDPCLGLTCTPVGDVSPDFGGADFVQPPAADPNG